MRRTPRANKPHRRGAKKRRERVALEDAASLDSIFELAGKLRDRGRSFRGKRQQASGIATSTKQWAESIRSQSNAEIAAVHLLGGELTTRAKDMAISMQRLSALVSGAGAEVWRKRRPGTKAVGPAAVRRRHPPAETTGPAPIRKRPNSSCRAETHASSACRPYGATARQGRQHGANRSSAG